MNEKKALVNGVIYSKYTIYKYHALLISGDRIVGITTLSDIPSDYVQHDVQGLNIAPGLIDLQVYGSGKDLFSAELTSESLHRIEQVLLMQGCTTFYLTLATNTIEVFKKAITVFGNTTRSNALGLHLEGPFLNPEKKGAHPEKLIIKASLENLNDLFSVDSDVVKMMTVAPELLDKECLEFLLERDIVLSAGHSAATSDIASTSFDKGIKTVTHLWNAMSPFHHREVGLPGASMLDEHVYASIIADGIHVDYETIRLSKAMMKERLFLITDAVAACNKDIYQHVFNGDHYVLPNGVLSGSALSLLQAVKNCVQEVGIPLNEALRMATLYPARVIESNDLGHLDEQAMANVVIFDDEFEIKEVFFEGKPNKGMIS